MAGKATFYSYQTKTNTVDDGNNVITRIQERKLDHLSPEIVQQKLIIKPSNRRGFTNSNSIINNNNNIARQQIRTNTIGTGLEREISPVEKGQYEKLMNRFRENRSKHYPRRGFKSRARTVESPALSVDSGGQASSSLASEVAKLLDVKQGYYADVYNKMERPSYPTKRPADAIEDAMRVSVLQMFNDQQRTSGQKSPARLIE